MDTGPARGGVLFAALAACALLPLPVRAQTESSLDRGFAELYEFQFDGARDEFQAFANGHPEDPMGPAAIAASYLYEELAAQGVFTSQFFLDDKKLLGGVSQPPDPARRKGFLEANARSLNMANVLLQRNSRDPAGLYALTISVGMQADYMALIEKRQWASLKLIRQAEDDAARLLAVDPNAHDANLAIGAGNYIVGCLPGYKRAVIWFGGIHGDRQRGMDQLGDAASHGHYLRPFAKALLALSALREHKTDFAHDLFRQLHAEFPANPVFAHELDLLDGVMSRR